MSPGVSRCGTRAADLVDRAVQRVAQERAELAEHLDVERALHAGLAAAVAQVDLHARTAGGDAAGHLLGRHEREGEVEHLVLELAADDDGDAVARPVPEGHLGRVDHHARPQHLDLEHIKTLERLDVLRDRIAVIEEQLVDRVLLVEQSQPSASHLLHRAELHRFLRSHISFFRPRLSTRNNVR